MYVYVYNKYFCDNTYMLKYVFCLFCYYISNIISCIITLRVFHYNIIKHKYEITGLPYLSYQQIEQ